jgi:hypothetical protein
MMLFVDDVLKHFSYEFKLKYVVPSSICNFIPSEAQILMAFSFPESIFPRRRFEISLSELLLPEERGLEFAPDPSVRDTVDTPSTNLVRKITLALLNIPSWKKHENLFVKNEGRLSTWK